MGSGEGRAQDALEKCLTSTVCTSHDADSSRGAARGRAGLPEGVWKRMERGGWASGSPQKQAKRGVPGSASQIPVSLPKCVPCLSSVSLRPRAVASLLFHLSGCWVLSWGSFSKLGARIEPSLEENRQKEPGVSAPLRIQEGRRCPDLSQPG